MNKKYIINNGSLIMGDCESHSELVINNDDSKVTGGGWWYLDRKKSIVYLYADSHQYGQASLEDVKESVEKGYMTGFQKLFKYAYSNEESLYDVRENHVLLERKK